MEYSTYYETKLYPLQNEILKKLKTLNQPFYLTGGTAVSRGYLHHRYSDDLDLFANATDNFLDRVEEIICFLEKEGYKVEISPNASPNFSRLFINKGINGIDSNGLKIDFVNDIDVHFGEIQETEVYYRTDSLRNILSNKYTALYRLSVKDVVDICEIAKNCSFNWKEIIKEANEKEGGIDLKEVVQIFNSYSEKDLLGVKWIKTPNIKDIKETMNIVAFDMLNQSENSLCKVISQSTILTPEELGKKYMDVLLEATKTLSLDESKTKAFETVIKSSDKITTSINKQNLKSFFKKEGINTDNDFDEYIKRNQKSSPAPKRKGDDDSGCGY